MVDRLGTALYCGALLVLVAAVPFKALARRDPDIPTMTTLPNLVRATAGLDRTLRIGLVSCNPDAEDARLRPGEEFHLRLRGGPKAPPSPADTALVAWLRAAAPRLYVSCAPLRQAAENSETALAEAVTWALGAGKGETCPEVLYIPGELLKSRATPRSEVVSQALVACWKARCLPVTVAEPDRDLWLGGLFAVSLMPRATEPDKVIDLDDRDDLKWLVGRPISLRLLFSALEGAPPGLDDTRAAAAYLALAAAALPVDEPLAHLERAARLGQAGSVHRPQSGPQRPYRLLDVRTAADPSPALKIAFIDQTFPWPTRIVDLDPDKTISVMKPAATLDEIRRRVAAGVHNEARLRHLAAVAQLAGLQPLYLTRVPEQGLAFYRLDPKVDAAARKPILELLHTLEGRTNEALFNDVAGDAALTPPRPE